jgi:hypothetical protein
MRRFLFIVWLLPLLFLQIPLQADDIKTMTLSPVPLSGNVLKVKLNNPSIAISICELRNLVGTRLQRKAFPAGSDELYFTDMTQYPPGVYMVAALDAYGKVVDISKFMINR